MFKTKKFIAFVALISQVLLLAPAVEANIVPGQKKMLLVSAYYSPLPNQRFYMKGSYEADMILNGRGTNGADGTEVYVGMLAAPKSYPFGTRIRIPGLGVGEVHDRGGAILARKNYDRIDVWMGHGEDGLSRALNWGMQLVEGEVFFTAHQVQPGLSFSHVSAQLPSSTLNRLLGRTQAAKTSTVTQPAVVASPKTSVTELQEALKMFGYYSGPVDGIHSSATEQAVLKFQLAESVIPSSEAVGAGHFGPKTRLALKARMDSFNSKVAKEQARLEENLASLAIGMGKHSRGDEVYQLQQMLWELGYYNGALNGDYDDLTIDAVYEFQKATGVLQNNWDQGAGYFGKKTHEALAAAIDQKLKKVAMYPKEKQAWVPAKVELPQLAALSLNAPRSSRSLVFDLAFEPSAKGLFHADISMYQQGADVRKLQTVLIEEGFLASGLNTGYFGGQTKSALIAFQLERGVIASESELGAGRVGPGTRAVLNAI